MFVFFLRPHCNFSFEIIKFTLPYLTLPLWSTWEITLPLTNSKSLTHPTPSVLGKCISMVSWVTYLCAHVSLCPRLYMPKKVVFCAHVSLCPRLYMPKKVVFCAHVSLCPRLFVPTSLCAHVSLCPCLYMPKPMPVGVSGRHPLCQ